MEFLPALTTTFDASKPSLFELLSEQQLAALLPPSLRYLLAVATHRHPRYLLRVLNSFDELYAILMLLVERHFLKTQGGGFTENFYGLKREKALAAGDIPRTSIAAATHVRDTLKLSEGDIWRNLAVMVGIPYLKRKLDEAYEINAPRALLGTNYTRMPSNPTWKQWFAHYYRLFLRKVYPGINAAYYLSMLVFNVAYLFDNSKYHSPFMWLIGTRVRRLGEADYKAFAAMEEKRSDGSAVSNLGITSILSPRIMGDRALNSLKFFLPTSIFALKFLEWWHASDFARQLSKKAAEGLELPPPVVSGLSSVTLRARKEQEKVKKPNGSEEKKDMNVEATNAPIAAASLLPIFTVPPPKDSQLCPICESDIVTATACQTGFVFCYTCIHRWLEGNHDKQEKFMKDKEGKWDNGKGRCAVTGRRVLGGTEGLRRIIV